MTLLTNFQSEQPGTANHVLHALHAFGLQTRLVQTAHSKTPANGQEQPGACGPAAEKCPSSEQQPLSVYCLFALKPTPA